MCGIQPTFAGHNSAVNVSYECLGGGEYKVLVNLFRDCADSEPSPDEISVYVYSSCETIGFVSFPRISVEEVSQLCPAELPNSTCNGGGQPGVELSKYELILQIDPCSDWRFVVTLQYRTMSVNLVDPSLNRIHVEALLNNTLSGCQNSPVPGVLNLPLVCVGNDLLYNLAFTDPDGDSLSYALVPAMTSILANLPYEMDYTGSYSGSEPLAGITINPFTGQLSVTPAMQGVFNAVVEVRAFRNGVLKSIVSYDFLFFVNACPSPPPAPVPGSLTHESGGGYPTGEWEISICPGDDFCFSLEVFSPDALLNISAVSTIETVIPGSNLSLSGANPTVLSFCGTAPTNFTGGDFVVLAKDDACPVFGQSYFAIELRSRQPLSVTSDQVLCKGETIALQAANDAFYTWFDEQGNLVSPGPGFSCNPCANPVVVADSTVTFTVEGMYDGGTCAHTAEVEIYVPLELGLLQTNETCAGNDGLIQITILTGSGVYSANWDDIGTNAVVRSGLSAGNYSVTISDLTYGCTRTEIFEITAYTEPEPDAGPDDVSCQYTYSLQAQSDIGVGSWSGPEDVVFDDPSDPLTNITVPSTGIFNLVWTEDAGYDCLGSDSVEISFFSPPKIENSLFFCLGYDALYAIAFDATQGISDGYAVSGVTGEWSGQSFLSAPIPSETAVEILLSDGGFCGSDTLTGSLFCPVLSFSGAMDIDTLRICGSEPALSNPAFGAVLDDNDSLRYILHTLPGNTPGDVLAWNPEPVFSFNENLSYETTYFISAVVGNAMGEQVNLNDPLLSVSDGQPVVFYAQPEITLSGNEVVCPGEPVTFPLDISGALPQILTFEHNGMITEAAIFDLSATLLAADSGSYTLISTTSEFCPGQAIGSAQVNYHALPSADIGLVPTICEGESTQLNMVFSGLPPFEFSLYRDAELIDNYTNIASGFDVNVTQSGTYAIIALNDQLCSRTDTLAATLEVLPLPIAMAGNDTIFCSGDTIQVGVPQIPGQTYSWETSGGWLSGNMAQPLFTTENEGIQPLEFTFHLTAYLGGCVSSDTIRVDVHPLPQVQLLGPDSFCAGDTVSFLGYGGTEVVWQPANQFLSPNTSQSAFTALIDTEITLTLKNSAGCAASLTKLISVNATPDAFFLVSEMAGCAPFTANFTALEAGDDLIYIWNDGLSEETGQLNIFAPVYTQPGVFQPSLIITNGFGCSDHYQPEIPVEVFTTKAVFSFSPEVPNMTDSRVIFINESPFGVSSYWTFDSLGTATSRNSSFLFPDVEGGTYEVCLDVLSPEGCMASDCQTVVVRDDFYLYIPTAFTPDGDGLNDLFGPVLSRIDLAEYRFWITNRNGLVVFETRDPSKKWDGSAPGSGYYEGSGVYFWQLIARPDFNLETKVYQGKVVMIR